ncbi:MAG: helix-turn-helix domain-containing protein, partial [Spirochaetes bacterium]|nr:helix-turn-helix domain-containing protein [Spirochaetota bacterium]
LLKIFCKRIYDAKRQLMVLTLEGNDYRVADVFLLLAEKQGIHTDERMSVEIKASPEEIANMCAISPNEVIKVLNNFQKLNKIELRGNKIMVNNISETNRQVQNKRKISHLERK